LKKWKQLDTKIQCLIAAFAILGFVALMMNFSHEPPAEKEASAENPLSVDTYIPKGFVLIPLQLANAEALSSLVGDVGGIVDLYLASRTGQSAKLKVGSKLKLLRAPLNPQQYAVLVKESESSQILSLPGPFIAVVQNPAEKGQNSFQHPSRSLQIDYQN